MSIKQRFSQTVKKTKESREGISYIFLVYSLCPHKKTEICKIQTKKKKKKNDPKGSLMWFKVLITSSL